MEQIINKYEILKQLRLNKDFIENIKLFHVFEDENEDHERNVFIVTNDDKIYAFGRNCNGVLGFGHMNEVGELTVNEELSHKQIIDFKNSFYYVNARTIDGKIYSWGWNINGVLGNKRNDSEIYKPELNQHLSDKHIIDICCGFGHSLALTIDGEVFAWGENHKGQIGSGSKKKALRPFHVEGFNGEKIEAIACGYYHSMALTERGNVYSWGSNKYGQLGLKISNSSSNIPKLIKINVIFKKISCGDAHSLLLSRDGDIYAFGSNQFGQLGDDKDQSETPLKLNNKNIFIDIATHCAYDISIALSKNGLNFIWGKYGAQWAKSPFEAQFRSFDEIFAKYFQITYKSINIDQL